MDVFFQNKSVFKKLLNRGTQTGPGQGGALVLVARLLLVEQS
jgi:hypothetical protein